MLHLPYLLKVIIAAILAFMMGWTWYGPLFGKRWMKAAGLPEMSREDCKNMPPAMKRQMQINMAVTALCWLVAALMYGWIYNNLSYGAIPPLCLALAIWAGFSMPPLLSDILWSGRSKDLIWIAGGYNLVALLILAVVIGWL